MGFGGAGGPGRGFSGDAPTAVCRGDETMDNYRNEISTEGIDPALLATIVHELNLARRHVSSYPKGHPVVSNSCERVVQHFSTLFAARDAITIGVAKETLFLEGQSLERLTPVVKEIARALFHHGLALVTFRDGLSAAEIEKFNRILMWKRAEIAAGGGIEKVALDAGLEHIRITRIRYDYFQRDDGPVPEGVGESSSLWETFVQRLVKGEPCGASSADCPVTPEKMAGMLNESSGDVARLILDCLETSLCERKETGALRETELESLRKLGVFVGSLGPELRGRFLESIFNSFQGRGEASLEILPHLPETVIPEVFEYVNENRAALSPLALSVAERLAGGKFVAQQLQGFPGTGDADGEPSQEDKFQVLFQEEIQEEFVPREYLETLKRLAASSALPEPGREELEQLKQTLAGERVESSVSAIILSSLGSVAPERLDALKRSLIELCRYFLELGDFRALEDMYDRLIETAADDGQAAGSLREEVLRVFEDRDFAAEVMNGLDVWGKEKYREIGSLMQKVGRPFVEPLLDRLADEENRVLRRYCLDQLVKMGEIAKEAVVARLGDPRWYFVRNLVLILGHMGDSDVPGILRRIADFPHPRVRQAVVETFLRLRDPEGDRLLLRDLASDNGDIRMQAVKLAGKSRDARVRQALLHVLGKRGISPERFAEKKAAVHSLASMGGNEALPELGRMLGARRFFRTRWHDMLKKEIILTLGKYDDPLALDLLRKAAQSSQEILALPALEILGKMEGRDG